MAFTRRKFLTLAGATTAGVTMASPLEALYARVARGEVVRTLGYGPLTPKVPVNTADLANTAVGDLRGEAILALPPGFEYKALSITGQPMSDGTLVPAGHDGMAAFPGPQDGTVILVRNHELSSALPANYNFPVNGFPRYSQGSPGGTTTLVVGRDREVTKSFVSIAGTRTNCAGGPTPWRSWITCEETFSTTTSNNAPVKHGYCFEVTANANSGIVTPAPIVAMGRFSHEAVAVDPATGYIYETEDRGDSCFYRFIPNSVTSAAPAQRKEGERRESNKGRITAPGQLAQVGGTLYALKIKNGPANTTNNSTQGGVPGSIKVGQTFQVEWVQIDNVDPIAEGRMPATGKAQAVAAGQVGVRYQAQDKGAAIFFRGEGCWYGNGLIYFVATQAGPTAIGSEPPGGNGRGNGQVWAYNPAKETLTLIVEAASSGDLLDEPDNVTVAPFGDLFLCEDGSDDFQYVVGVNRKGELYQVVKNVLFSGVTDDPAKTPFVGNEFAGACFSPDGRTLFVNIQTPGITFAIWGPWTRERR